MTETRLKHSSPPPPEAARSKGEKLFDWLVYGGLGGVATFLVTIPLAYWMRYSGGEAKMATWLDKVGVRGNLAKQVLNTTTLSHGGNLMILPIAYAEARHAQIVDGLNKMVGDPTPVEEIQAKNKPTFGSLVRGRVTAWLAVLAGFVGFGTAFKHTVQTFENEMGERFCKLANVPRHYFAEAVENGFKTMKQHESKTYRIGVISAQDIFATACAATLLYFGSHFFARKKVERAQHQAEAQGAQTLLPLQKTGKETIIEAKDPVSLRGEFAARVQAARHEGAETTMQRI